VDALPDDLFRNDLENDPFEDLDEDPFHHGFGFSDFPDLPHLFIPVTSPSVFNQNLLAYNNLPGVSPASSDSRLPRTFLNSVSSSVCSASADLPCSNYL
jgi:hypothetical protein